MPFAASKVDLATSRGFVSCPTPLVVLLFGERRECFANGFGEVCCQAIGSSRPLPESTSHSNIILSDCHLHSYTSMLGLWLRNLLWLPLCQVEAVDAHDVIAPVKNLAGQTRREAA